jgi:hypothetical protein
MYERLVCILAMQMSDVIACQSNKAPIIKKGGYLEKLRMYHHKKFNKIEHIYEETRGALRIYHHRKFNLATRE